MLAELALLALTRTDPALRALGFVGDAVRLWSRRGRCRAAWAEHEARCHAVVSGAMDDLPRRRKALILGSGLVRDVPIERLSAAFERVVLVDAVHLPVTRRRLRHLPNLDFVLADIAGVARWIAGEASGREDPLAPFIADGTIDLIVSANLLSQLPLAPETWAEANPDRAPMKAADLARAIIGWHLADLRRFRGRVCLLTDTQLRLVAENGHVLEREDLLRGETLPPPDAVWDWLVAPKGEAGRGISQVHTACGYRDFARPHAP